MVAHQTTAAVMEMHPCYTTAARVHHGRLHLAVAQDCNLGCRYCERCVGAGADRVAGPGTAARLLSPAEANALVSDVRRDGWLTVVGIAGPGEPLANRATFATLRLLQETHPDLLLCLSTNGIELQAALPDLIDAGVRSLTVTINTVHPRTAGQLYDWAVFDGSRLLGAAAAAPTLERQWNGLAMAVEAGLLVKVNSVLIPGLTEADLEAVARRAGALGVHRHNIMPLIPRGRMSGRRAPTRAEVAAVRDQCERWIPQLRACTQCRADAIAPPTRKERALVCGACG